MKISWLVPMALATTSVSLPARGGGLCDGQPPPGFTFNIYQPSQSAQKYCANSFGGIVCADDTDCAPGSTCAAYDWCTADNWSAGHKPTHDQTLAEIACIPSGLTVFTYLSCGPFGAFGSLMEGPAALYLEAGATLEKRHHSSLKLCSGPACPASRIDGTFRLAGDFYNYSLAEFGVVGDLSSGCGHQGVTLEGSGRIEFTNGAECFQPDGSPCGERCQPQLSGVCGGGSCACTGIAHLTGAIISASTSPAWTTSAPVFGIEPGMTLVGPFAEFMPSQRAAIHVALANLGTVIADGAPLRVARKRVGNTGVWKAENGGTLELANEPVPSDQTWVVERDAASAFRVATLFDGAYCDSAVTGVDGVPGSVTLPSGVDIQAYGAAARVCDDPATNCSRCEDPCASRPAAPGAPNPPSKRSLYLSFRPAATTTSEPCAVLVRLVTLAPYLHGYARSSIGTTGYEPQLVEGMTRWVGPTRWVDARDGSNPPNQTRVATVGNCFAGGGGGCADQPHLHAFDNAGEWGANDELHVYGDFILPESTYEARLVCGRCASPPLTLSTSVWGDVTNNGVTNFQDIPKVVDVFRNLPGNPGIAFGDLTPDIVDQKVNFIDIGAAVKAFQGLRFVQGTPRDGTYTFPPECP